jgi:hypothetical protein
MINCKGEVLYEGPITEQCSKFIASYKNISSDSDTIACKVYYSYLDKQPETQIEIELLSKLYDCDYDLFDSDIKDYKLVWIMK